MPGSRTSSTALGKRSTMTAVPLGASASSQAGRTTSTSKQAKKPPTTQKTLFEDAERIVPDLDGAVAFLRQRQLIPPGEDSVSQSALTTGLIHFAFASPTQDLARKGLIAFAHLAKAVLSQQLQDAIAPTVAERVETQIQNRLDHHTTQMEEKLEEATTALDEVRKEADQWVERLTAACTRVEQAEDRFLGMQKELQAVGQAGQAPGASQAAPPPLTLDTAPVRTRRAVNLAELLQRQLLVRGAALKDPQGNSLTDREVLERARQALELMEKDGLTPPAGSTIEAAKVQSHGDVVYTFSNAAAARWIVRQHVSVAFSRKMGMEARIVERLYKLVVEGVPVGFEPHSTAGLRVLEEVNGLDRGSLTRAEWIKPPEKRYPGQRTAFLLLTVSGIEQANHALKGLMIMGRRALVRRELVEPKRCAKCQGYEGHFAKECPSQADVCATCAGAHPTAQCDVKDPALYRCASCGVPGHAAWDRNCPTLRLKVRAHSARRADSGFRFFVTNNPETWVTEEEELLHAPPPPTVWSQIRQRFVDANTQPGRTQARLDNFFGGQTTGDTRHP